MSEFLTFLTFWVKSTIVDRVSRTMAIVEGATGFNIVINGVGDEKMEIFDEIPLVESIFIVFV